ncbi:uncharacterized protein I303_107462 [Kwoniella dejecticola CBS 10117]|uniref:Uncharacterized protein n=1 Tax=Kwoniella dejecticola CBS 10117 TaxID=1296121 RepID=A0A1A5ZZT3_9TREE|nr:uncharacterized protein I303_06868 [Kwoniella dejecticola CBS 10117]OBR83303.1 hypothetical protein I303_06868 [Kwoniella dejecticola CBS 10117]
MSQPIAITFHFPRTSSSSASSAANHATGPSSRTLSKRKRKIATNNRILASSYITIDKAKPPHPSKLTPAQPNAASPPGTSASTSSSSGSTSASTINNLSTGSKRRKGPVYLPPPDVRLASLTPLLRPIVSRCTISSTSTVEEASVVHASPSRKRSKKSTPVPNINAPSTLHPYSKSSDLSNTRSSVPSPREIARNKKLEEEKAALKKQNAAVARANAIAKRRSNRKPGRGGKSQSRRSSFEATTTAGAGASKPSSPEEKNAVPVPDPVPALIPAITTQAASEDGSPLMGARATGMKRTRSQGVLPISTSLSNSINGSPVIGSPLKEVMSRDQDEEGEGEGNPKKRSKLSDSMNGDARGEGESDKRRAGRRANTHSPTSNTFALPDDERLTQTVPLPHGKVLPRSKVSPIEGGVGLRRSVSNTVPTYGRSGSVASVGSNTSENGRIKRETQLPERLRDYEMKAVV